MTEQETIEGVARDSYGRLVAMLAARSHDIQAAEDALQDAFAAAIVQWPATGAPADPSAWLMTVAKRRLLDGDRRQLLFKLIQAELESGANERYDGEPLSDDRLELMLVCAHPAIDAAIHAPLILQVVLGLRADRIAAVFLVSPSTMGQRLVRAKQKIRDARMAFELPGAEVLEERLDALIDAIYAAYGTGWEDIMDAGGMRGLADEAMVLARAILLRMPDHPETLGLLALMCHTAARKAARRDVRGRFVPLSEQDHSQWDRSLIAVAEEALRKAARAGTIGRYQLEAAIQSAHVTAHLTGQPDSAGLFALYEGLVRIAPGIGVRVAHAAAAADVHGPEHALGLLSAIEGAATEGYQAYHAVRADLLSRAGHVEEARIAYVRAIGPSDDAAVREHLTTRMNGTT